MSEVSLVMAGLCLLAGIFQSITARHSAVTERPLARKGKHVMAAGFFFLALRLAWIGWSGSFIPGLIWGLIAVAFIALGSIMTNFDRVLGE